LLGVSQNDVTWFRFGKSNYRPKIVMKQQAWFSAFCASTLNRLGLKLHDISDVTFSTSPHDTQEKRILLMYKQ